MNDLKTSSASGRQRRKRILVVEDDAMLQMLLQGILQHKGYEVRTAAGSEEALDIWRQTGGGFDLLLTDVVLPDGMTGLQIAEQLQAQNAALKVIYASGFTTDTVAPERNDLVEGTNFLHKPYTTQVLVETLQRCLSTDTADLAMAA